MAVDPDSQLKIGPKVSVIPFTVILTFVILRPGRFPQRPGGIRLGTLRSRQIAVNLKGVTLVETFGAGRLLNECIISLVRVRDDLTSMRSAFGRFRLAKVPPGRSAFLCSFQDQMS